MDVSRRTFLQSAATAAASIAPAARLLADTASKSTVAAEPARGPEPDRFDPWIEVIPANLAHNATTLRQLGGRPILAVIKNHGYGLDYRIVARLLEPRPEIEGFALVRADEALTLRQQGIRKPILLMARVTDSMMTDLAAHGITLAVYADDDPSRLARLPTQTEPIAVHAYIDTGMSRMGIRYDRATPFLRALANVRQCRLTGTFMTFTEDAEFDREQLSRFQDLTRDAAAAGIQLGKLHAASSHSIFHHRDVGFDMLRPGMSLYGGYPDKFDEERAMASSVRHSGCERGSFAPIGSVPATASVTAGSTLRPGRRGSRRSR